MRRRFFGLITLCLMVSNLACGESGPTTPTETRIISLSGDIDFGEVEAGQFSDRTLRITNTGNATLTVTNLTGTNDLDAFFTSLQSATAVFPGATVEVRVTFGPQQARAYLATANVQGDMTSGTNTFRVSGIGVIR